MNQDLNTRLLRTSPRKWRATLGLAAASMLFLLAACRPSDNSADNTTLPPDLPLESLDWNDLRGHIVSDLPLMLLPSRAWEKGQDDTWLLANSASLLCQVMRQPDAALDIELPLHGGILPGETSSPPCLEALWDGDPDVPQMRWQDDRWHLEIAPRALTEGTHFLSLRRCDDREDDAAPRSALQFDSIGFGLAEARDQLAPGLRLRYQYLADLLTYGVTSAGGNEKLDGFVIVGERRVALRLPASQGGLFSATLHNSSRADKRVTFRLPGEDTSFEIGSLQRQRVQIEIPSGVEELELITQGGHPAEFFQIAAPHFIAADSPSRPSIVLITLDTTRRDALGAYGGAMGITPNLDSFADHATVFDNARSTAPWTLPSHASMFTGLYPTQHGAGVSSDHLESDIATLTERLRDQGYLTAGFAGGPLTGYLFGLAQGFSLYRNPSADETPADQLTDHVQGFLTDYVEPVRRHQDAPPPVFLFINYFDPHFPYRAPQLHRDHAAFDDALQDVDATWRDLLDGSGQQLMQAVQGDIPFTEASRKALRAAYRAETSFMDQELGRLMVALRNQHLLDNALILITSDHGELLGEGGYFTHNGRLDPELLEIPLILKTPGQKQGSRVDSLVSLVDVFPTLLQQAGLEPGTQDGLSLLTEHRPALLDRPWTLSEEHDTAFHRLPSNMRLDTHVHGLEGATFRRLTWQDTAHCFSGEPGQWQVQAPCQELDPAALTLQQRVADQARESSEEHVGLSAEEQQQLRALGYIQ